MWLALGRLNFNYAPKKIKNDKILIFKYTVKTALNWITTKFCSFYLIQKQGKAHCLTIKEQTHKKIFSKKNKKEIN